MLLTAMNRKKTKYLCLFPILLILHSCFGTCGWGIKIDPASPESVNSSIDVSVESPSKTQVLEIVHQVAEKYGLQEVHPLIRTSLVSYGGDPSRYITINVNQKSPNSFTISLEQLQVFIWQVWERHEIPKQILSDLVDKLSEGLGNEYIINQRMDVLCR